MLICQEESHRSNFCIYEGIDQGDIRRSFSRSERKILPKQDDKHPHKRHQKNES